MMDKLYPVELLADSMSKIEVLVPIVVLLLLMGVGGYAFFNQQVENEDGEDPDDTGTTLGDWEVYSVVSSDGLPDCEDATQGRLYFVESESAFYVCKSNGWMFIDLTGETGATGGAGAPGQNGTSATILRNLAPLVSIADAKEIEGTAVFSPTNGSFIGYSGYDFKIFRTMVDIDGTIVASGWDFDLDGTIDQSSTDAVSVDSISIPVTNWVLANSVPGSILTADSPYLMTTFAFIAIDDDGAATAELHTLLFDSVLFGNELDESGLAGGNFDGPGASTFNTYTADDAADDASAAGSGSDTLIKMQMTGSDDLAWSFVKITLSVGDNVYTCSVAAGDDCTITQAAGNNDNAWEPGEYIFLAEGGAEICSAQGCNVSISVTHNGRSVPGDGAVVVN